mgnify:FL=1
MSISMYFGVSWLDPRIKINDTATEWREVKTGPKDVSAINYRWQTKTLALDRHQLSLKYSGNGLPDFFFSGSERFARKPEIHLVSRTGNLRAREIWQTACAQRDVRGADTSQQNHSLRIGVSSQKDVINHL